MEIQRISGPDAVSSGFSVYSDIHVENSVKNEHTENTENRQSERIPEETKGNHIDTYT